MSRLREAPGVLGTDRASVRVRGFGLHSALAADGFIDPNLNEWGSEGKNYVNGLFKRLHSAGSHPGLSDQEDSTFRRHIVLITALLFLNRFDARRNP